MKSNKYANLIIVLITLSISLISYNQYSDTGLILDIISSVLLFVIPMLAIILSKDFWYRPTKSEKLNEFHKAFSYKSGKFPSPLSIEEVRTRNKFVTEELIESLFGTVYHNEEEFKKEVTEYIKSIKEVSLETIEKNKDKPSPFSDMEVLIEQTDGYIDAIYFLEGTFDMLGVESTPVFDIVHSANMNKLGEDGKPIIREEDGKILKPTGWVAPEPLIKEELKRQINSVKVDDIIDK